MVVAEAREFTEDFPIEECQFRASGGNPFFNLTPGRQAYFTNQRCVAAGDCDELEELWITVTSHTRTIPLRDDGMLRNIPTRVVQEFETADGELVEISRNYFATCSPDRDVYYFGEAVDIYEDGRIVSHDGAWLAGRRGAEPGIIMPDRAFLLGSRYFQEFAPGIAQDRAEHVASISTSTCLPVPSRNACGSTRPRRWSQVTSRRRPIARVSVSCATASSS